MLFYKIDRFLICLQIFVLVVAYGLYHGLIFFPVILSLIGPAPFAIAHPVAETNVTAEELEPQLKHNGKPAVVEASIEEEIAIGKTIDEECNV